MRVPRIFSEQALSEHCELALEEAASHHLIKVLRMQAGRALILFNGDGHDYKAEIISCSKKSATVSITDRNQPANESPLHSHLAIGISRGERFDFVLQKATELGVSEITPLFTERTEVKLSGDRLDKKMAGWRKIIISACEQCGRAVIPTLNTATALAAFTQRSQPDHRFVLHHRNTQKIPASSEVEDVSILVGPEGGLSEQEIELANQHGFLNLALGPRVLRTETAPLAALALMQHHWGDI